jgi:hypothetical protein
MSLAGETVLIAEPRLNRFVVELQDELEHRGATVVVARDVRRAIALLNGFPVTIVVIGPLEPEDPQVLLQIHRPPAAHLLWHRHSGE